MKTYKYTIIKKYIRHIECSKCNHIFIHRTNAGISKYTIMRCPKCKCMLSSMGGDI